MIAFLCGKKTFSQFIPYKYVFLNLPMLRIILGDTGGLCRRLLPFFTQALDHGKETTPFQCAYNCHILASPICIILYTYLVGGVEHVFRYIGNIDLN